jgi:hypothetical protein
VPITFTEERSVFIGGIYNDQFVRTRDGWRFKLLKFTRAFTSENPQGWKIARRT